VQALNLVSRKNSAFYKANALTGFQTACLGGVGEACLADPLLQREKRDLEWTMSYLLKACELGETAGCDQLVAESKKAILEGLPRWKLAAGSLKTACYDVENRSACLMFALGHVRGWWEGSDPEIGRAEHLRQCRLGSDTACIEFASRLLETAPDQREWALQILRQACSESQPLACVHLAQALRRPGTPDAAAADRAAVDVLRVACYGQGGSQPQYYSEYDYDRSSYTSTYNNPACAVLGIFLLEGIGLEANEAVGFRLLSSGCAGMAGTSCVQYGEYMKKKGQVTASVITPVYERICMDTHEEGCFALAELKRTGYKELKPSEAEAKKYQAIGCRLAPAHPSCKNVK